jgi:hypothetical protein
MIAGIFIGHYVWILTDRYIHILDSQILGIPLEKRMATTDQMSIAQKQKIAKLLKKEPERVS